MVWGPGRMAFGFQPAKALETLLELAVWGSLVCAAIVWLSRRARLRLTANGG